jgi:hypothetical protein
LSYDSFLDEMKHLLINVLKRDETKLAKREILGTHFARKMAYLLAYWGFARDGQVDKDHNLYLIDEANIHQSARHKSISSIATYISDCATLFKLVQNEKNKDKHRVGKWVPIHMKALSSFESILLESSRYRKPLPQLASWYVRTILCPGILLERMSIPQICEKAISYKPDLSIEEEMKALLFEKLSPLDAQQILQLHSRASAERARAAIYSLPETNQGSIVAEPLPTSSSSIKPARSAS